jgi:multidrug transporter EmrE-like cation transporter
MSLPQIFALSAIEIVGDFSLKSYANDEGGIEMLLLGILGYVGVVGMLIVSLQGSSVLLVNGAWDAVSTIIESVAAYVVLGERFDNYLQYVGLVVIVIGLYLLKVPWKKSHPFHIPLSKTNKKSIG